MTAVSDEVRPAADAEIPPMADAARPAVDASVPSAAEAKARAAADTSARSVADAETRPVPVAGVVRPAAADQVAMVDLLDRLVAGGGALSDDLVIGVAGVDLVRVPLHALIAVVRNGMAGTEHMGGSEEAREGRDKTWSEMG